MYERKGKLNVVIFMDIHTFKTQFMVLSTHTCNYWFYTHSLVVSERCYIIEDHTCMKENGNFKVVIFMDIHTFNTQFMVSSTHTCN